MSIDKYKEQIEKQASLMGIATKAVSKAVPAITKGVKGFASMSLPKRALVGAGAKAALNGVTYKNDGSTDPVKGRLAHMAKGALGGASLGALAGKSNISGLGSSASKIGDKVFDYGAGLSSQKASNIIGNAGIGINSFGNKIMDSFK